MKKSEAIAAFLGTALSLWWLTSGGKKKRGPVIDAEFPVFSELGYHFGRSSRRALATVHPELRAIIVRALELSPYDFAVVSGIRTREEQISKVEKGVSRCDPREGCISDHLEGRAVDIAPLTNGAVELEDKEPFRKLAPFIKLAAAELELPIEWLGDRPIDDVWHWNLPKGHPAPSLEGYRRAHQSEVTPEMTRRAQSVLPFPLHTVHGPWIDRETGQRYKVALEVHSNAPKGASVFLLSEPIA